MFDANKYPDGVIIGLDVGSTTVKAVIMDPKDNAILWSDYKRHETKQPEKCLEFLKVMTEAFPLPKEKIRIFITGSGGTIATHLRLEGPSQDRIREVVITGDFFVTPPKVILNLEAALRGVDVEDVEPAILGFFEAEQVGLLSAQPADFVASIRAALSGDAGAV